MPLSVNTPSDTDSLRVEFRAGMKAILDAYKAARPYDASTGLGLAETYDYPPESYHTPCAYVEKSMPEVVNHDAQTRTRVATGQVVLVSKLISNAQATREQDVLVDELHEWFTKNPKVATVYATLAIVRVQPDVEITDANGTRYSGAVLTIEANKPLGRS